MCGSGAADPPSDFVGMEEKKMPPSCFKPGQLWKMTSQFMTVFYDSVNPADAKAVRRAGLPNSLGVPVSSDLVHAHRASLKMQMLVVCYSSIHTIRG